MVNLPVIPSQYAETAQKLLTNQPLTLVVAHLIFQASKAEQKAEEALRRASESDKRVRQAVVRIGELKAMLLQLNRLQPEAPKPLHKDNPPVTPERQPAGLPHTMSFGGNVIDTPGPDSLIQDRRFNADLSDDEELVDGDSQEEEEDSQEMGSEEEPVLLSDSGEDLPESAEEELSEHENSRRDGFETGGTQLITSSHFVDEDLAYDSLHAPSDPDGDAENLLYSLPGSPERGMVQTDSEPSDPVKEEFFGPKEGTPLSELIEEVHNDKEARVLRMKICIGDEVELFGNQTGIVKFAGSTQFAKGNLFGLELNDGSLGKNNGDHDEVQYFTVSKAMKGVFVRAKMIRRKVPLIQRIAYQREQDELERKQRKEKEKKQTQTKEKKKKHEKEKANTSMKKEHKRVKKMNLRIGDDVQIDMGRKGMVAFIGVIAGLHPTHTQYGIALTHGSIGDTDGTVDGVEYFHAEENRGVFVTPDKIRKKVIMSIEEKYLQRIEDIFEEHAPKKMEKVRKMVKDADNLHQLYVKLCNKYEIQPAPEYRGRRR